MNHEVDLGYTDALRNRGDLRSLIDRVAANLSLLRLNAPPSSRIMRHIKRAEEAGKMPHPTVATPRQFRPINQAFSDLSVLDLALRTLGRNPKWRPHFERVLSGAPLPWEDANDLARNTEFELYLGAILAAAGYSVWPGEPDVVASLQGWELSFAAKRLRSERALQRRAEEGLDQVVRSKRPGFVVMEVSATLLDRVSFLQTNSLEHAMTWTGEAVTERLTTLAARLRPRIIGDLHLGLLFIALVPTLVQTDGTGYFAPLMVRKWHLWQQGDKDPRFRKLYLLMRRVATVEAM